MTDALRSALSHPRDASMILPLIKRQEPPSDEETTLFPQEEEEPVAQPLVGDLNIFYVFDLPEYLMYVSRHDCETLNIDAGNLRELSARNLVRRRGKPEILRPSEAVMMLKLDGDLEASLLVVDILWPQLARGIPGETIVAVPSRDLLAVSGTEITGGIETLRHAVRRTMANPEVKRTMLLTRSLLVRRNESWQLLDS